MVQVLATGPVAAVRPVAAARPSAMARRTEVVEELYRGVVMLAPRVDIATLLFSYVTLIKGMMA